jgi:hypothetical protein
VAERGSLLDTGSEAGIGFSAGEGLSIDVHACAVGDIVFEAAAVVELRYVGAAIRSEFGGSGFNADPVVFVVLGH